MVSVLDISKRSLDQVCARCLEDLRLLTGIRSEYDPSTVSISIPYGQGVAHALEFMADIGLRDGFEIRTYDGHVVALVFNPQQAPDETRVDVVGHVDVVPASDGWMFDPYSLTIHDGKAYARGVFDMKGPLLAAYHALLLLKDSGFSPARQIRIVAGGDEERTMQDMVHYLASDGQPAMAFTPDGFFPVSIGEKGALMWRLSGSMETGIHRFEGGVQCNVVPSQAFCEYEGDREDLALAWLREHGVRGTATMQGDVLVVAVEGKSAHASVPTQGVNASLLLCRLLMDVFDDPLARLLVSVFGESDGSGAALNCTSAAMGSLTINCGVLHIENGTVIAEIDCRYPESTDSTSLTWLLSRCCAPLHISLDYDAPPVLLARKHPLVDTLMQVHQEFTGVVLQPVVSGGVTYSKVVHTCVAFGPHEVAKPSSAHKANEFILLDDLYQLIPIYADALARLSMLGVHTAFPVERFATVHE